MVAVLTSYCQLEILRQIESSTKRNLPIYFDACTANGDSSIFSCHCTYDPSGCNCSTNLLVANPSRVGNRLGLLEKV